jgi:N-acetylneuraminate synthase
MPHFVAEIGINHNGDPANAIRIATRLKGYADVIKFQHMHPRKFLSLESYNSPHPVPENSFGASYGEHKEFLYWPIETHREVANTIRTLGMQVAWSVWNHDAVDEVLASEPAYVKIPSALCNDFGLLQHVFSGAKCPIHISFGMTRGEEREALIAFIARFPGVEHVLYDSTSDYSNENGSVYMTRLNSGVCGFSCHAPSIAFGIVAASHGFDYVEYHVTLSRDMKGTDHTISLEVEEFQEMVSLCRDAARISDKRPDEVSEFEASARKKLWLGGEQ